MPYIVNIQTGSRTRGNFARSQSIQLPNKERVRRWIKRNNLGNLKTKITIKNTITKKILNTTKAGGSVYGWDLKNEIRKRRRR